MTSEVVSTAIPSRWRDGHAVPVLTLVGVLLLVWYLACIPMNAIVTETKLGNSEASLAERLSVTWSLDRAVLPAPHQIVEELWRTIATVKPWSPRSLLFHGWVTLSSTLVGFGLGALLGIGLAVAIVHVKSLNKSLMPWIVASQTIPILAIAPMVIVVLGGPPLDLPPLISKAVIAAYLTFFPVVVGMVKGLRSPDAMQFDLLRTYNASRPETFWKLRLPASMPYLFASLKVGVAAAVVGTIVAELPSGATAGLGARLLQGSYYGQTIQIWAALFTAAFLAAGLVMLIGAVERRTLRRMGMAA